MRSSLAQSHVAQGCDQDALAALDYTQSGGFTSFMAPQTPLYKDEATLLREPGATKLLEKSPVSPVLGPAGRVGGHLAGGRAVVHAPIYKRATD